MLFTDNLEEIIFNRHNLFQADEFIVISGYLGPGPIRRLQSLPFNSKVVYGMYGSEGIKQPLHTSLRDIQILNDKVNVYYSNFPVHSKCYVWKNRGEIVHALIGSANFSVNGLTTPYREVLAETTYDSFDSLNHYIIRILNNSQSCLEVQLTKIVKSEIIEEYCNLSLLGRNGEVQNVAGLNWGQNPSNNTRPDDAYIKIRVQDVINFPDLFPPKQINPMKMDRRGRDQRHNDAIEIIWDDGLSMNGLFEGTQTINGVVYPKQVSSFPVKSELGVYIKNRIGVPLGQPVRLFHLQKYGRTDITITKLGEGVYKFDFSV
ncbi:MAG: NgoFVII family restriction endonuclease [Saprospiraceae bacterium]|nr:NgoFVII family restriction endonuclease [Saprospiraceae bacterium]